RRTGRGSPRFLSLLRVFLRLAEQELADEALENHRRLRERDAVAVGELLVVAARLEPDVGFAEQPRSEDRRRRVLRKRIAFVERERHRGLELLVVEMDLF